MDIKLLKHQTSVLPDIHRSKKGSKVNLHANLIENCMPLNVEMSKTLMHKIIELSLLGGICIRIYLYNSYRHV